MLSLKTSIQQFVKAELRTCRIDDLVSGLSELGRTLALSIRRASHLVQISIG